MSEEYLDERGEGFSILGNEDLSSMHIVEKRVRSFFGKDWKFGISGYEKGLYDQNGKLAKMISMISEGKNDSEIHRTIHCARNTLSKVRRVLRLIPHKEKSCPCGKPITHLGGCWYRVRNCKRHLLWKEKSIKYADALEKRALDLMKKSDMIRSSTRYSRAVRTDNISLRDRSV